VNSAMAGMTALVQAVRVMEESFPDSCARVLCFDGQMPSDSYPLFVFRYGDRMLQGNLHISIPSLEKRAG